MILGGIQEMVLASEVPELVLLDMRQSTLTR